MLPDLESEAPNRLQDPLDLRATPRMAADLPVSLYVSGLAGPIPARVRDLSTTGACVATPGPFALKSLQRTVISLPSGSLSIDSEGCWQRDGEADDVMLTGVNFTNPPPEVLDHLWALVFAAGQKLARFLIDHTQLYELGVEEGLGLAQSSRYRDIPAGRTIYRQDTSVAGEDSVFILIEGSVALQARVRDAIEIETQRLHPGELFGGWPLLGDGGHAESAVAVEDSRLLEIDRQAYRFLRQTKPWLGYRLGQALLRAHATRLRALFTRIQNQL
jgi:hypothetical protein